jgi:hypothetical protein
VTYLVIKMITTQKPNTFNAKMVDGRWMWDNVESAVFDQNWPHTAVMIGTANGKSVVEIDEVEKF